MIKCFKLQFNFLKFKIQLFTDLLMQQNINGSRGPFNWDLEQQKEAKCVVPCGEWIYPLKVCKPSGRHSIFTVWLFLFFSGKQQSVQAEKNPSIREERVEKRYILYFCVITVTWCYSLFLLQWFEDTNTMYLIMMLNVL